MKKMRIFLLLALTLVLASATLMSASAASTSVLFKAYIKTYPNIVAIEPDRLVVEIPGEGFATHLGKTSWYSDMKAYFNGDQTGTMEFTAANGDKLFGKYEGVWSGDPAVAVEFEGTIEITRGTGRFKGVKGTGTYQGTAGASSGDLYFEGMLSK
jgi:hypothetical protein